MSSICSVPVNDRSKQDNYVVGMAALGVLLSIALIAIVILTLILLRRRHTGKFKMEKAGMGRDTPMMTEVKIRPKSTNLELQGHMPLLDSPSKTINLEKHCYEKSALLLPMLTSDSLKLNDHYADGLNDEKTMIGSGNFISNNRSFEQVWEELPQQRYMVTLNVLVTWESAETLRKYWTFLCVWSFTRCRLHVSSPSLASSEYFFYLPFWMWY